VKECDQQFMKYWKSKWLFATDNIKILELSTHFVGCREAWREAWKQAIAQQPNDRNA